MGADLIFECVEIKETKEKALERLAKIAIDENTISRFFDCNYYEYEEEDFTPELAEKMRKRIIEAVEVVYGTYRDTGTMQLDGDRTLAFTGGMSWGDSPTEAITDYAIFNEFLGYPFWANPNSEQVKNWEASK